MDDTDRIIEIRKHLNQAEDLLSTGALYSGWDICQAYCKLVELRNEIDKIQVALLFKEKA